MTIELIAGTIHLEDIEPLIIDFQVKGTSDHVIAVAAPIIDNKNIFSCITLNETEFEDTMNGVLDVGVAFRNTSVFFLDLPHEVEHGQELSLPIQGIAFDDTYLPSEGLFLSKEDE